MTHVSDDDIMLLAETVEEHLVFSKDQLTMMEQKALLKMRVLKHWQL